MRLEVLLKANQSKFLIPINYNYPLSAVIYKVFASAGPNFADWLHKIGFSDQTGKRFKFFNFSRLYFDKMTVMGDTIMGEGYVKFYISSPIEDTLVLNFINGLMETKSIFIGNKSTGTDFKIVKTSIVPVPKFDFDMRFIMLSPTVASTRTNSNQIKYLLPNDPDIGEALANNLRNKYQILNNKTYHDFLLIELDLDYIEKKGGAEKVTKLISIKEGSGEEAKIKGFMTPLHIIGSPEIIKLAYFTGIGEKNSLGFGAIETKNVR